jgi:hypothetical protein
MLAMLLSTMTPPAPVQAAPILRNSSLSPCNRTAKDEGEITVCGRQVPSYRIDPQILAADRIVEASPSDTRNGLREVTASSCHDEPKKCDSTEIIPLLPVALKVLQVTTLAIQGEDWRGALRTRPDGWEAYQNQSKRSGKAKICVGFCSRRP